MSLNKYVTAQGLQGTYGDTANPVNRLANIVTRIVDRRRPRLRARLRSDQRAARRTCARRAAISAASCPTRTSASPTLSLNYDPEVLNGWGIAALPVGVLDQRAARIAPRLSVDVGLLPPLVRQLRRDRQPEPAVRRTSARSASTAPVDPRLPDGGGYTVSGF